MAITVGIRELRQHPSRYLRRVRAGETITVTDRGEPFAEIRPIRQTGGVLDRMIAEGRVTPPTRDLATFLKEHPPLPPKPGQPSLSQMVIDARADERW